uniref:Uncharacterized protein n=1 Tax=Steinernema glaseri TaxID=37863 RepID=A0A1I7YI26_9BILA
MDSSCMYPLELAELMHDYEPLFGRPSGVPSEEDFRPNHIPHYFPKEGLFLAPYDENEFLEEASELLREHHEELTDLPNDGARYDRAFSLLRQNYLIVKYTPKPEEQFQDEFLETWRELLPQIPSIEEVRENNPNWGEEQLRLFEELRHHPEKLFSLSQDEEVLNKVLDVLEFQHMAQIPEEGEDAEDEGLEVDFV